jgi:hypothetical protein
MAMIPTTTDNKLQPLGKLGETEDWPNWFRRIKNRLNLHGYASVLKRQKTEPVQTEEETDTAFSVRMDNWQDKRSGGFALIDDFCNYRASTILEEAKTQGKSVVDGLAALEMEFKGSGSGRYEELCIQFNEISLASCKNVAEYGSRLQQILDGMKAVHPTVELPEPFTVQKFLHGLGDGFSTFKTTFNLQFTIVPIVGASLLDAEQPAVSLRRTIKAAEEHESRSSNDDTNKAFYSGRNRTVPTNRFTECTHCQRRHPGPICWELDDTNASQAWKDARTRRRGQAQVPSKRKRSNSTDDGVTTMGKDRDPTSRPAFMMLQSQALENIETTQHHSDSLFYINNPVGEFMAVHQGLNLWNYWILDSGASGHLIGRKDVFVDGTYTSIAGVESNGIGGAKVVPIGKGTIRIECKTSAGKRVLEIPGVQYSPNAGVNLISLTEIWPFIDSISKSATGMLFNQGRHQFSATITSGLMMLDTTS